MYVLSKCPPILLSFFEVIEVLMGEGKKIDTEISQLFITSTKFAQTTIVEKITALPLRSGIDICKGELHKKLIDISLNTWSIEEISKYSNSIVELLLKQSSSLNADDTDSIQYSLAALRNSIEAENSLVTVALPESSSVTNMMTVLLGIFKQHKKMVNLIQYMVDILGIYFDSTERVVTAEQRSLFTEIIETGYTQSKENGDVMKELVRVAPRFFSE